MLITVTLEALTGSFNTDIDRASKKAEKDLKRMQAESAKALKQFGKIAGTAIAGAITGFGVLVKNAIDNADEMGKLAQKVGIATEELSAFSYAAKLADVDTEGLQTGLVKLGKSAVDSKDGIGDAAAAFDALGVSVTDAQGNLKSTDQLFLETADAFSQFEDGPEKAAAAMAIFGKAGADLIPLLNGGSAAIKAAGEELRTFGGIISQETADAADQFNDNVDKLITSTQGLAAQVAAELLPQLGGITEHLLSIVKEGDSATKIADGISAAFRVLSGIAIVVGNAFQIVGDNIAAVAAAAVAIAHGDFSGAIDIVKQRVADLKIDIGDIAHAFDDTAVAAKKAGEAASTIVPPKKRLGFDPDAAAKAQSDAKKALDDARRLQEAISRGADEIFQAQQDRQKATLETSLNAQRISYEDYLKQKLQLTEAEIDHEIDAAKGLLQNATEDEKALLDARIKSLEIRRDIAKEENADEEAQHVHELALAYEDAARAAKDYLAQIQREHGRSIRDLDSSPAEQRRNAGRDQVEDAYRAAQEQVDAELEAGTLIGEEYNRRSELLKQSHDDQLAEVDRFYAEWEAKQADFSTGFKGVLQEYLDSTKNVGEALANDLVGAIDSAISATADLAAETLLWGGSGEEAAKAIARSLITDLVSSLIKVGLQMAVNFALAKAFGTGATAAAVGEAGAVAAAWAPAAIGASIATFGAASGIGLSSYLSSLAVGEAATLAVGAFEKGGVVSGGKQLIQVNEAGEEFVVNAAATRQNRSLLESINDGTFDGGVASMAPNGAGAVQLEVRNMGEPMDIRVERVGRRLIQTMTPAIASATEAQIASGVLNGLGPTGQAIGRKFGVQGGAVRD